MKELELYVHIPFCIKKCEYCDFLSGPSARETQEAYMKALYAEIQAAGKMTPEEYHISSVFIGGGTPSVVPEAWMEQMMENLYRSFAIAPNAEISIEANPGTVNKEKLSAYRRSGINRISFGCQSADNRELKMLGRIHTWEEFLKSFELAREMGFDNINVDLMSGLPEQTVASWEKSLRKIAELEPEHISAYSLILEEGTPFYEKDLSLPEEEEERRMYEQTEAVLSTYGFHQYEISNYARTGRECQHNIGYWIRKPYLGLGLGSASLFEEERFSNTRNMNTYLQKSSVPWEIREDRESLSLEEQMAEFMILGLRLRQGISRSQFEKNYGHSVETVYGSVLQKYEKMGLLEMENDRIRLTKAGVSVSNPILAEFL